MNARKQFMGALAAIAFAVSIPATAQASNANVASALNDTMENWEGQYLEVDSKIESDIKRFALDSDVFRVAIGGFYDVYMAYNGKMTNVKYANDGVSFDCSLAPAFDGEGVPSVPAHVTLTQLPSGVYEWQLTIQEQPDNEKLKRDLPKIEGTTMMYKTEGDKIVGSLPAKLGEKVSIGGLIRALAPYYFTPEMMSTARYLRTYGSLDDTEVVRQDEHNRFLSYAYGSLNQCMDCKYWFTNDGKVLLVIDLHDATYEYPQSLRFFLFDPEAVNVREIPAALSAKWPSGEEANERGICYQVRYYSDGLVALVPQTNGDSLDVVTLKFDGEKFY